MITFLLPLSRRGRQTRQRTKGTGPSWHPSARKPHGERVQGGASSSQGYRRGSVSNRGNTCQRRRERPTARSGDVHR